MSSWSVSRLGWGLILPAVLLGVPLRAESEWKTPDRVSPPGAGPASDPPSTDPHLGVGPDGHVHLVWWESRGGLPDDARIGYREHDGLGWGTPVYLSVPGLRPRTPNVCVDAAGQPHVVWVERSGSTSMHLVRYTYRSRDNGWIQPERVSVADRVGFYGGPQVAVLPSGEALVVWADDQSMGNPEVFWNRRRKIAGGGPLVNPGFGTPQPLSTINQYHSSDVRLASMGGGRVAALWLDRRREGYQAMLRIYDGENWSFEAPVGGPAPVLHGLCLVSGGEFLHYLHGVDDGIAVQTAASDHLYSNGPVVLPVNDPGPSFCAASLDGERLLLAYRETVSSLRQGVLFAREYSHRNGEFAGVPSVIGGVRQESLSMSLEVSPAG